MRPAAPTRILPILAALSGALLSACAGAPNGNDTPVKESTPMSTEDRNAAVPQPKLDAETALSKVVELIRGSKNINDFTAERLTAVTGLPMNFDGVRYGAGETLTSDWAYGFHVDPDAIDGRLFSFAFIPLEQGAAPPATSICNMDFDRLAHELQGMGFNKQVRYGEHDRSVAHDFYRPGLWVSVIEEGEDNEPPEALAHRCVRRITIK